MKKHDMEMVVVIVNYMLREWCEDKKNRRVQFWIHMMRHDHARLNVVSKEEMGDMAKSAIGTAQVHMWNVNIEDECEIGDLDLKSTCYFKRM